MGKIRIWEKRKSVNLKPHSKGIKVNWPLAPPPPPHACRHTPYQLCRETGGHSGRHFLPGGNQEGHSGQAHALTLLASKPQERLCPAPLQHCQPSWPARGARAASFSSSLSLMHHPFAPFLPPQGKRKGQKNTHLRRSSLRKSHLDILGFSGDKGSLGKRC